MTTDPTAPLGLSDDEAREFLAAVNPTGHATPALYLATAVDADAGRLVVELAQARVENARLRERAAAATEALNHVTAERARLKATDAAYWQAQKVLDDALGEDEDDGAGEGLAADVWLLAQQRDAATEARDRLAGEVRQLGHDVEREQGQSWVTDRLYGLAEDAADNASRLVSALAATAPPAAPSEPQDVETGSDVPQWERDFLARQEAAERATGCQYTDHDLFTNRRLRCDKPTHEGGMHRLVFADEPAADQGMVREAGSVVVDDEFDEALNDEPAAGGWVSAEVYWVTTESLRAERDALAELRMQVVMALCVEDDDEERTDAEVVQRVRELTLAATDESLELDRLRTAGDEHLQALRRIAAAHQAHDASPADLAGLVEGTAATLDRLTAERDTAIAERNARSSVLKDVIEQREQAYRARDEAERARADAHQFALDEAGQHRVAVAEIQSLAAELAEARQEAERLRGEVDKIAAKSDRYADQALKHSTHQRSNPLGPTEDGELLAQVSDAAAVAVRQVRH